MQNVQPAPGIEPRIFTCFNLCCHQQFAAMPDPSSERDDDQSRSHESDRHPDGESGSHHGHRRRRRHRRKREKPTSKVAMAAIAGLLLIVAAAIFFVARPRIMARLKQLSTPSGLAASQYVAFSRRTVIIMNPTDKDWPHSTVTVNDEYKANCPEIPKGTQFEIWYKSFRGPKGE